jgi:Tfp pilus assembly protein PilN
MLLGASSPAARSRPRLIDLNLIPAEYRRRPFPLLTTGLGLLVLGSLLLLYAVFYAKTYSDLEVSRLATRVSQAQAIVQTANGNPTALAQQEKLRAMSKDYQTLAERQIHWGDVFQTIADVPPGVVLKSVGQAGFGITINGSAIDQATAARYVDQLRNSGLFVNAAIQMRPASGPVAFTTPTPTPTRSGPPATTTPPVAPIAKPPTPASAPSASYPTPRPPPTAAPTTPRYTSTVTRTSTPTATPTPAFDFVLVSSQQLPASNPLAATTDIRGTVLDKNGKAFPGVPLEIDSEGSPAWSATTTSAQDGSFDFSVTHGKFKVYPLSGRSQPALDLYTGADGVPGVFNYQLEFRATFSGTIPPTVVGTPTDTPTETVIPTSTPTPISPGANIASLGCASAYMIQNGAVKPVPGNSNPNLAIDGNLGTEWNAGIAPSSGTQVIWQWSLPEPGQAPAGCSAAGLSDDQDQIDGFQLIPDQNPSGFTTHELWLYTDPSCTNNITSTGSAYYTFTQTTSAGTILALRILPAVSVRCVIIRTLTDPSDVAWEEVQIYQALPPPSGFPTSTASPTPVGPTPTATPTPPGPTATVPPTSTPFLFSGVNVAPYGAVSIPAGYGQPAATCTPSPPPPGTNPNGPGCAMIDNDFSTYWAPAAGSSTQQFVRVDLTNPPYFDPTKESIGDVRILVSSQGAGSSESYQVYLYPTPAPICSFGPSVFADNTDLGCPIPSPTPGLNTVFVYMFNNAGPNGTQDGTYGIRELQIYKLPCPACLPTVTPTATNTPLITNTPTPTPTATRTSTSTPIPSPCPSTCTPTATPILTPTVTNAPATPTGNAAVASHFGARLGLGQGPGDQISAATTPLPTAISSSTAPVAPSSGPVDFTIILEVASGKGYP